MARVDHHRRTPIIVDGRYPRSQSSRRGRRGMYVLLSFGIAGLAALAAVIIPWQDVKTTPKPVQPVVAIPSEPATPPTASPPALPSAPPVPAIPESSAAKAEPPAPKAVRPKPKTEPAVPVDLDRVLAMLRSKETSNRPPDLRSNPTERPAERPADLRDDLVTAREMLMAGRLEEARDLLIRVQTRLVFAPVTPDTPDRNDINPMASRVNAAIRAIHAGNQQAAIQTLDGLITAGLDWTRQQIITSS